MKRGIVAGKFMPLHTGHVALVRFAAAHCDELVISVFANAADPIPGDRRLAWVREEFMRYVRIKVVLVDVPGPDHQTWTAIIADQFGPFNYVFGSGNRDEALAEMLDATYVPFDTGRNEYPVSGKEIRLHPFRNWDFIAQAARGYFVKRICFYGPESTGKSTLAQRLALHYRTEFVSEVAKEFISSNQFTEEDIVRIGKAQTERVLEKTTTANKILFCDTDLITTQIYSGVYLKKIPSDLKAFEAIIRYDYYFLFDVDVPWVADGLRDLGEKRLEMFQRFKSELDQRTISYTRISGSYAEREKIVRKVVDDLLVG